MEADRPSDTALGASIIRTVHQLIDDLPLILEDPISPKLLAEETLDGIRAWPARYRTPEAKGLRSHVVLRSRYAEDRLHRAVQSGVSQFVNLGAGFDTFAYRQPPWSGALEIVEVDHPASQEAKLGFFSDRGLLPPGNVRFVPLDMEGGNLIEALASANVDLRRPAFFACLGVLAYLTMDTVRGVFEGIAAFPKGTCLVLAFAPKDEKAAPSDGSRRAAIHGEPWLTYFTRDGIESLLKGSGFSRVDFLTQENASEQYYKGRTDLPPPRLARLCTACI